MLKVKDFTRIEILEIKQKANFTKQETELFDLRNEEKSLESCAELMNCSIATVNRIHKRMLTKIIKVM